MTDQLRIKPQSGVSASIDDYGRILLVQENPSQGFETILLSPDEAEELRVWLSTAIYRALQIYHAPINEDDAVFKE